MKGAINRAERGTPEVPRDRRREVWLCDSLDFFLDGVTRCYCRDPRAQSWEAISSPLLPSAEMIFTDLSSYTQVII